MAQFNTSGTATISVVNNTYNEDLTVNYTMTGSNATSDIITLPGSNAWVGLLTSSLSSIKYLAGSNIGTGSCQLARDAAGTKLIGTFLPGDAVLIPDSGSLAGISAQTFFARNIDGQGTLFSYSIVEF